MNRTINRTETVQQVRNNPADPYGPPLIRYAVRVRDRETGRWWYIRSVTRTGYIWTSDHTYARLFSLRTARAHQSNMTPDILNR